MRPTGVLAGLFGIALAAVAFAGDGGLRVERTTEVEIALMLVGGALTAAAVVVPRSFAPLWGGGSLLAFGALAAFTALSITWSLAPSDSWLEANRTFAYLAVFAAGIALARLIPHRWPALLHGVALACVAVCGYALLSKCFPASFSPDEVYARLREPFGYWNSVGLMAALGVPPLLWLAARRAGHLAANALAWPALGLLLVCLMLSYSRGALLALVVGLAVWFVFVPLRLRAAAALVGAILAAAPVVAWAFSSDDLTEDNLPLYVRSDAGHELAFLLAGMVIVLLAAGLAVNFLTARHSFSPRTRTVAGRGLLGVLALLPVAAVIGLASAPGGIDGQLSKLTDPDARTPANTPNRLTETSSVRARYWDEGFKIFGEHELTGAGAGAYGTARTRFRTGPLAVRHAHGFLPQTLADLGLAGLALSLAAFAAWLLAARRPLRGGHWDPERIGLYTLLAVVVVFGVHSFVDWTWFVPGNAAVGLLAAGWLAGRGPRTAPAPEARAPWRAGPVLLGAAALIVATAVAASWAAYQPVRSIHASDAAVERVEKGQLEAALSIANIARDRNPLSVEPLWEVSWIEDLRGNRVAAERALEQAIVLQPANGEAWRRLGRYRLSILGDPEGALPALRAAYYLDSHSPGAVSDFLEVQRALSEQ